LSELEWDDMVLVGRIARPHGLRGQVAVNAETDFVEERFRQGAVLWTRGDGEPEELTVASLRVQNGKPIVAFEGFTRIDDVEPLAGRELRVPESSLRPLEPGRYYEHQLVGCSVETIDGVPVGTVVRIEGGAGGSRLVVEGARSEIQVPMVEGICAEIDVAARRIRIDPPEGLLELNETRASRLKPAPTTEKPVPTTEK
jgi:16S rRNA processing protein RimM